MRWRKATIKQEGKGKIEADAVEVRDTDVQVATNFGKRSKCLAWLFRVALAKMVLHNPAVQHFSSFLTLRS